MKRIYLLILLICVVFTVSACGSNNTDTKKEENVSKEESKKEETKINLEDIYMEVLENKKEYTTEANESITIQKNLFYSENMEYAILDLDEDNEVEMVIGFEDSTFLILNYEDEVVYGFELPYRGLMRLKTNGHYLASGGADLNAICINRFSKNKRIEQELALEDGNEYSLNGQEVSKEEYEEYLNSFFELESVTFKKYMN